MKSYICFKLDLIHDELVKANGKLDSVIAGQFRERQMEQQIMATLEETLAEVTDQGTRLDSVDALIAGLQQQIAEALAGTTLPPAVQSKVDAVFSGLQANKAKIDTALNTNVPPATPAP